MLSISFSQLVFCHIHKHNYTFSFIALSMLTVFFNLSTFSHKHTLIQHIYIKLVSLFIHCCCPLSWCVLIGLGLGMGTSSTTGIIGLEQGPGAARQETSPSPRKAGDYRTIGVNTNRRASSQTQPLSVGSPPLSGQHWAFISIKTGRRPLRAASCMEIASL